MYSVCGAPSPVVFMHVIVGEMLYDLLGHLRWFVDFLNSSDDRISSDHNFKIVLAGAIQGLETHELHLANFKALKLLTSGLQP